MGRLAKKRIVISLVFVVTLVGLWGGKKIFIRKAERERQEEITELRREVASAVADQIRKNKGLREEITPEISIDYTIDEKLENYIKGELKRYRSDYSSVVVIDNNSGDILAAVGYQRKYNQFDYYQPFSSTHPAASLFKIVTSASLLEGGGVEPDTKFTFRGKGTTLYKYQLRDKRSRWQRNISLENAFAFSNNVVFGKAAIKKVNSYLLYEMAEKFGFNEEILNEVSFSRSKFEMPESQYQLAEMASGFNKKTLISPVHGAVMASIIAREGEYLRPSLLDRVVYHGENIWNKRKKAKRVIERETAKDLKKMMSLTVKKGTARGSFRRLSQKLKKELILGGKTGSITGGIPFGKRDWFTAFAMPRDGEEGLGISICVMNVNVEKWYVRSSYLAKNIIEYYYKKIDPIKKKEVKFVELKPKRENENV